MRKEILLSTLPHTWIFDIDGTLVKHNGHLTSAGDTLLEGVAEFFAKIPAEDMIILITARSCEFRAVTEKFLAENKIRYDHIIFDAPVGERILVNDNKPDGLATAYAIKLIRDSRNSLTLDESDGLKIVISD